MASDGALAATGARSELARKNKVDKRRLQNQARKPQDRKLRRQLKVLDDKYKTAVVRSKDAEILLRNTTGFLEPEAELERTYKVRQDEIAEASSIETAQKRFELKLEDQLGPYMSEYTRNGRHLLLAGAKGHVATMDWREGKLGCELQLGETIRDARWLHNNQFFALAQKQFVYIYDSNGVELHCLRKHTEVTHMEFLPYHFLLATLSINTQLKYQDVSTGQIVAETPTKLGSPVSLAQNPYNAILHVGHQNGTVTLWSPNSSEPLVKLLAHRGPVRSLAVDREGRYMVSTADRKMAVWDIRMFKEVNTYFTRTAPSSVVISDTGLTAVGGGTGTTIWKSLFTKGAAEQEKIQSPYMTWRADAGIRRLRWCPFEDVLGVGHDKGFSSIVVPGAGEANFDALEVNPFETGKQRQEGEVRALLNKLKPEMIALDPNFIGNLDLRSASERKADKDAEEKGASTSLADEIRNKARGKNGALKKYLRKQRKKNIIDEKRMAVEEIWKQQQEKRDEKHKEKQAELGPALARFARKE